MLQQFNALADLFILKCDLTIFALYIDYVMSPHPAIFRKG